MDTSATRPHARRPFLAGLLLVALAAPVAAAAVASADDAGVARALARPHAPDRVIVGFKAGASKAKRKLAVSAAGTSAGRPVSPLAEDTAVVRLVRGTSVGSALLSIGARRGVAWVEPDYRVWPAATADDPWYARGDLWGMYGDGTVPHANAFGTGAGEAWADGRIGSAGVHVGIVDEGVKITHPDLEPNVWTNPWESVNGRDDDGNGYIDDIHGWDFLGGDATVYHGAADDHGTHVAGTIGARGGNGRGVAGVSWRVTLIPARFMGPGGGYISDAIAALDYITDLKLRHGLRVVATNNSWSGGGHSEALADAIARAGDADILFVAAAGNEGRDIDRAPVYPAAYRCATRADGSDRGWDCLMAVANLQPDGARRPDSDWGAAGVDLGAPGTGISSTHPDGVEGYAGYTGTSMAAAHVSGAAALCASLDPALTARQIHARLIETAAATDSLAGLTVSGGRLDAGALAERCAPEPVTVYVDDLDPGFRRYGSGWRQATSGYADHHFWAPTRVGTRERYAVWRPELPAGRYQVLAHIPRQDAATRSATYKIRTPDGWVRRTRDQQKGAGRWVGLGVHQLTPTSVVQLIDKTGESGSLGRRVAFDAVRFVPLPRESEP